MEHLKADYFRGVGWFILSLCVCIFNDSVMKLLGGQYAISQVIFLRYLFATLSLIPCMLANGRHTFKTRHCAIHSVRAVMLVLAIWMYCFSLKELPLSTVITVNFTIPMFTLLLARMLLGEKIGRTRLIATLLGFVGICVTAEPANVNFASSAILILVFSSVLFAGLDVINKKFVIKEGILTILFYTAIVTLALVFIPALANWECVRMIDWALFALLGIGANLLLYCVLNAFKCVEISAIAPFRYIEFILSIVVGFLFFNEIPPPGTLIGACIIIPSMLYIVLFEVNRFGSGLSTVE
jgi:S-adenosylmethionine uptake transporter